MFAIFIVIIIFSLVLTICLTIVETRRRKYENEQLKNNLKKLNDANRL